MSPASDRGERQTKSLSHYPTQGNHASAGAEAAHNGQCLWGSFSLRHAQSF